MSLWHAKYTSDQKHTGTYDNYYGYNKIRDFRNFVLSTNATNCYSYFYLFHE